MDNNSEILLRGLIRKQLNELYNGVRVAKNIDDIDGNKAKGLDIMKREAAKHKTSEELLRSGGFSNKALDLAAFGFTEESVKELMPSQLKIKWKDDMLNPPEKQRKSGLSKEEWAKTVDFSKPVDVSFDGRYFNIEDGHHRYYASKILNVPLKVNLEIKANPIAALSEKGYDEFHRWFFDKSKNKITIKEYIQESINSLSREGFAGDFNDSVFFQGLNDDLFGKESYHGNADLTENGFDDVRYQLTGKKGKFGDEKLTVEKYEDGIKISDSEATNAYKGQINLIIRARNDKGEQIGKLEYVDYKGVPSISMIEVVVPYRRMGVATRLYNQLKSEYPNIEIKHGYSTEDGSEFVKSL